MTKTNRRWVAVSAVVAFLAIVIFLWTRDDGAAKSDAAPVAATAKAVDSIVKLDSAGMRLAGVELLTVSASTANELVVNGAITFDADQVSVIAPRAEGRLVRVHTDLGQNVTAGSVLATVESSEIGQIRGDLERARAALDVSRRNYEREKRLYEQNISPQKEMLDAEVLYRTAEADVRSAEAKLRTYGATEGQGGSYGLSSAVDGTVVERNASPGQLVGPTTNIFTVANLRHVWINVDVYEADFKRVHPGARARISPVALPGETFEGRVRSMGGIVDSMSHTFKVRVHVENPAQRLRPGMFAQVRIEAPAGVPLKSEVSLPDIAVQDLNGKPVVFVARSTPGEFVARPVIIGTRTGTGAVTITQGLSAGERVVVRGAFQLKAEMTKASSGEEN